MNLIWNSLDWEVPMPSLSRSSDIYFGPCGDKKVMIIYDWNLTSISVVSNANNSLNVLSTGIVNVDKKILKVTEVLSNSYMLDDEGNLYQLSLLLEHSPKKIEWSWVLVQTFGQVLGLTGTSQGLALLRQSESKVFIEYYGKKAFEFEVQSSKLICSSKALKKSYQVHNLNLRPEVNSVMFHGFSSGIKENLLIEAPSGLILITPIFKVIQSVEPFPIHFGVDTLLQVFVSKDGCIFLAYTSGRLVLLKPCLKKNTFEIHTIFLSENLIAVAFCESDELYIIWSEGFNLYHSKILNFSEVIHLKVNKNIRGVVCLVKIYERILAVTINCCFYEIKLTRIDKSKLNESEIEERRSGEILNEIYQTGVRIEDVSEKIQKYEDNLEAVAIAKQGAQITVKMKDDHIRLENHCKYNFKKKLWMIKIEASMFNKRIIHMVKLEEDFKNESFIKLNSHFVERGCKKLEMRLICKINRNLFEIKLPTIYLKENSENVISSILSKFNKKII